MRRVRSRAFLTALPSAAATLLVACTGILGDFEVTGPAHGPGDEGGVVGPGAEGGVGDGTLGGDGIAPGEIKVSPTETKIGVLRGFKFTANLPANWSVKEANGGTIDDGGIYHAPNVPGVYHLVASSKADATKTDTATVQVNDLKLDFLASQSGGPGNIDGPAGHAHFDHPEAIAQDEGTVGEGFFIADTGNHTIRQWDQQANAVTTLAGTPGVTGAVDAKGSAASFNTPTGIAVDTQNRKVYVADYQNHCIRAIDTADGANKGTVTTLAGKCGTPGDTDSATAGTIRFNHPRRVFVPTNPNDGSAPYLFVCEDGVKRLRQIPLDQGAVSATSTTILTGVNWNVCEGGTVDWNGGSWNRMYFTDGKSPSTLKRNVIGTTTVETLATLPSVTPDGGAPLTANSASGFANDTGFGSGHSIYLAFDQLASIYTYDVNGAANQTLVKLVGDPFDHRPVDGDYAKARFSQPMGLAGLGSTSAFFVTDRGANAIRRVGTNTGDLKVSTVVGRLSQCFLADGTGAAARFAFPTGVASDGAGFLYVTDASSDGPRVSNTIRKIELSTGNTSVHAGKPGRPGPSNLPVDGDATTGVFGIVFDLVVVGDSIYVTDPLAHAVRKVSVQTGAISTFAGKLNTPGDTDATGTGALFDSPAGITTDGAGNLYITDAGNFKVKKIEIATAKVSTIAGTTSGSQDGAGNIAQFKQPFGIASDRAGGLFVADMLNATIRRIDLSNNSVSTFLGTAGLPVSTDGNAAQARFTFPSRLAFDPLAGALYVSEGSLDPDDLPVSTVRRVDVAAKTVATHVGRHGASGFMPGPLDAATLSVPAGLAITPSGDLAITDGSDCLVGIVRPF